MRKVNLTIQDLKDHCPLLAKLVLEAEEMNQDDSPAVGDRILAELDALVAHHAIKLRRQVHHPKNSDLH